MQAQELLKQLRLPELADVRQYFRSLSASTLMGMGAFAAFTTYLYATRPKALKPPCDLSMQSVEIPGGELARSSVLLDPETLLSFYYEDAKTVYECFIRGMRVSGDGPCLGSRKPKQPYEWLSYSEVLERAENLGSALLLRGHSRTCEQYVGIFSQNRPEWTISELACHTYSLVPVPLYDTLGTDAIRFIIDQTCVSTVVCDVPAKARLLLDSVSGRQHSLRLLMLMEAFDSELAVRGQQCGVQLVSLAEAEAQGRTCRQPPSTSCPLTHRDTHVSYLPLAHMFEQVVQGLIVIHGARVGFFQGDIRMLMDDLTALKPTVFPVVPRVLNRMYDKIFGQANTPLKRWILDFAFRRKEAEMRSGLMRKNSLWDKLIFKKVQASVGGCVRLMMTGAAPVSEHVLTFLRAALGCQFYEGFGQTECTAGCTVSLSGDWTAGHVGPPLPCNHIKLVDVAEMNYLAANGEGEVCVQGPNVFKGYLNDPEKTVEAIDQDGWLHTGDIGRWLPNGTLRIVDRKKHLFKLAQGEYIAPEKIENIYLMSEAVAQAFVHGDSLQACLVAIIVPDPDFLPGWAKKRGFHGSYENLCNNPGVKNAILENIVKLGKESGLKSFEQVKDIALHKEMFSIQNGLLTPTLKAKRAVLSKHFRKHIDQLYASIQM
ncbi:long-chain-fatty-acid--CoA ligase 1b isoform X2 [Electrophorus electricus]|uniref:long-chain-fatty-acid--CoA ligase 1b isoform X2 n=1 Tax=Electrophorus electricus TaxID=8005 RepID=UPI0015CF82D0|nr:long-chain-fatty-acid--CoA ligase 1b isoform X2 [Electrophorus electricus]